MSEVRTWDDALDEASDHLFIAKENGMRVNQINMYVVEVCGEQADDGEGESAGQG